MREWGSLLTAVITPFKEDLEIDYQAFRQLLDFLMRNGSDGVVVSGTTGESPTLTHEEKLRLFEVALEEMGDRGTVIAGTCSYNTRESVKLSKEAEKLGVHGILAVTPYYNKPPQEGLYQHFRAIAEAVNIPIMLYNIPSRTGININPETVARLAEIPNIVAIKEASGSVDQLSLVRRMTPQEFAIYSGDDNMTLTVLAHGGKGVVSVAAHLAGKRIKEMIDAFRNGDVDRATKIHLELYPLFKGIFIATNPIPVKFALSLTGKSGEWVRPPLCIMNSEQKEKLKNILREVGCLS
ncbi:4-hydroxy-tetrahydrodipicolinate synthase [Atrimonas thermophila]|jgi:4-hydroxy-tetrahydrodipicolinate synthase|uniref:4-hydroxy-tetrahydrodipicolinate synthase n=1 Tax=Atrimonas thermophila TaxID=3064161 RepID=UPI00399D2BCE